MASRVTAQHLYIDGVSRPPRKASQIPPATITTSTPEIGTGAVPEPAIKQTSDTLPVRDKQTRYSKPQLILLGMACLIFLLGIAASVQAFRVNHHAATQAVALAKKSASSNGSGGTAPSTTKPSSAAVASYAVAPNLPRYLDIPSLGVHSRVLSLGILSNGALATPNNIYDVGWYNESSLPGQTGAMLIDGHVSSWTSKGVFYSIKNLKPGDMIQIQRGDGAIFKYQVVKSQVYPSGKVNMQSAITPVVASKPGLNLITCTGDVIRGTNNFNERIIVYAAQV